MESKKKKWLKYRGYIHLTNKIQTKDDNSRKNLLNKVNNRKFVASYAFYPLIYKSKFKRKIDKIIINQDGSKKIRHKSKLRPIHYATHLDAHIYAKYAYEISKNYEKYLLNKEELSQCIIGYRSINGKSTAMFAKEVFEFVKNKKEAVILTFDVSKFFSSLDHQILKRKWAFFTKNYKDTNILSKDNYNIYKSVTKFHYIKWKELKANKYGFDENKLSDLRKLGIYALYANAKEFRNDVQSGKLKIYSNQFVRKENDKNILCGIPQGLPISAILSNIYMIDFDEFVLNELILKENIFYRRYSDDIVIVCDKHNYMSIKEKVVENISNLTKLSLSEEKTEVFFYENEEILYQGSRNKKLKYLGLEFDGKNILLKSATIAKYYREMKKSIKSKERIIKNLRNKGISNDKIFKSKLYRRFLLNRRIKKEDKKSNKKYGNFINYVNRISKEIQENGIKKQIRNRFKIFRKCIKKLESKLYE